MFDDVNPLSPKYVLALVLHLPDDGAFYASQMGGREYRGWNASRYALVAQVNAQRAGNHILTMVNRDPKKKPPEPPESFPVPGQERKQTKPSANSFASIAASMFAAQRRKREPDGS